MRPLLGPRDQEGVAVRDYMAVQKESVRRERNRENSPRYGVHGAAHYRCPNCGAKTRPRYAHWKHRRDRVCRRCTSRLVRLFRWLRGLVL